MLNQIMKKPWLIALNLLTYSMLISMMGSCAHFSSLSPLTNKEDAQKGSKSVAVLQYDLVNLPKSEHSLYFRDSAGDLIEVNVPEDTKTKEGYMLQMSGNRAYRLEAIGFSDKNFLLKDLTQDFKITKKKMNYLGAMKFELKNSELVYSVLPPMKSIQALELLEKSLNLKSDDLTNAYTGKQILNASSPTKVELKAGMVNNSFTNYIETINPCYVKEWKTNPIILGKLDFTVTESNGVLRVKNVNSEHSASSDFEQCVWNRVSDSKIADKEFRIKIPGVLYF